MSGIIGGTGYNRWSRGIRVSIRESVVPAIGNFFSLSSTAGRQEPG